MSLDRASRVFVSGHLGMVGSAIVRHLRDEGFTNLVLAPRSELDLVDQARVDAFFRERKVDAVFHAAGRVGGIVANQSAQADFLYENMMIAGNVIRAALDHGVARLVYLGSSCVYPKLAEQPIVEEALLSGPLEPTNEGYAIAKIAAIKLCEKIRKQHGRDFVGVMPCNLYGPGETFHPEHSHVIPGLMRRFHAAVRASAEVVTVWGSGRPLREFLHVDDAARALLVIADRDPCPDLVNVGSGEEVSIRALAERIGEVTGFAGRLEFDASRPDGTPRKVLDVSRIRGLGWRPRIELADGLRSTYAWACEHGVFDDPAGRPRVRADA